MESVGTEQKAPSVSVIKWQTKIVLLTRYDFRSLFDHSFYDRWGFFLDRHLSPQIYAFGGWFDYPPGNHTLRGHHAKVLSAVVSSEGRTLFTGADDGAIIVWDLTDTKQRHSQIESGSNSVLCLAYHSGLLASGQSGYTVKVWEISDCYDSTFTMDCTLHLKVKYDCVKAVEFDERGRFVIAGCENDIYVFSLKDKGTLLRLFKGHSANVISLRFIGQVLISASFDCSVQLWNPERGTRMRRIKEGLGSKMFHRIESMSINCDRSMLICFWFTSFTLYSWPEMSVMKTDHRCSFSGEFHPSHPDVMAVSDIRDDCLKLIDIRNGICLWKSGYTSSKGTVRTTPDGTRLICLQKSHDVQIWELPDLQFLSDDRNDP